MSDDYQIDSLLKEQFLVSFGGHSLKILMGGMTGGSKINTVIPCISARPKTYLATTTPSIKSVSQISLSNAKLIAKMEKAVRGVKWPA